MYSIFFSKCLGIKIVEEAYSRMGLTTSLYFEGLFRVEIPAGPRGKVEYLCSFSTLQVVKLTWPFTTREAAPRKQWIFLFKKDTGSLASSLDYSKLSFKRSWSFRFALGLWR